MQATGILNYFSNILEMGSKGDVLCATSSAAERACRSLLAQASERTFPLQLDRNVRTFPLRFGFLREDSINNVDLGLFKHFGAGRPDFGVDAIELRPAHSVDGEVHFLIPD